jgi:hypothetical protein
MHRLAAAACEKKFKHRTREEPMIRLLVASFMLLSAPAFAQQSAPERVQKLILHPSGSHAAN